MVVLYHGVVLAESFSLRQRGGKESFCEISSGAQEGCSTHSHLLSQIPSISFPSRGYILSAAAVASSSSFEDAALPRLSAAQSIELLQQPDKCPHLPTTLPSRSKLVKNDHLACSGEKSLQLSELINTRMHVS